MGFYTAIVFNNDVLDYLDRCEDSGKRIHEAILRAQIDKRTPVVVGGCHVGEVVAQDHADALSVMTLSTGRGSRRLGYALWGETDEQIIRRLAEDRGFVLHRKPQRNRRASADDHGGQP